MEADLSDIRARLSSVFSPEELALLSPDDLRLLAALEHEELPSVAHAKHQAAVADYRRRVAARLRVLFPFQPPDQP